ncbi:hypothetical protein B0H10DRAFT_1967237 [Mycena sp. CBHHK59/15]|nr:hypothetical protein B0H10DRAFT_1967237 [Mycena sp. CBHHK59/15]
MPLFGEIIQHLIMWIEQLQTLPTTFTKMVFAVTSLQCSFLELDALYNYMTIYKLTMSNYLAPPAKTALAQCVSTFTMVPMVAQQLWAAGVPFWFLRPVEVFDAENILSVVPLQEPSFGLPDNDAHGQGAPPVLYSGNSTLEKIAVIRRGLFRRHGIATLLKPSTPMLARPPPVQLRVALVQLCSRVHPFRSPAVPLQSRAIAHGSRVRNRITDSAKTPATKGPAKTERDKFSPLVLEEMPPSIVSMVNALAQVDRSVIPYTSDNADKRYVLPEPALLVHTTPEQRCKFLHHCNLLADGFIYMLTQALQLFRPQEWRDAEPEAPGQHSPGVGSVQRLEHRGFPVPIESLPQFSLAQIREIVWQVAETSFRFEFCSLDKQVSKKDRLNEVKACFISQRGWAATTLEERHRYVGWTAALMLDWTTKSNHPNIIRRVADRVQWSPPDMQALETAVCRYYTQVFWEYFGRAAVVPLHLDHDVEKEGEL